MEFESLLRARASEQRIAEILLLIGTTPNKRSKPLPDDRRGPFDFWFDGGAASVVTGFTEYVFGDGTRAISGVFPILRIDIEFTDGTFVRVQQMDRTRPPATGQGVN